MNTARWRTGKDVVSRKKKYSGVCSEKIIVAVQILREGFTGLSRTGCVVRGSDIVGVLSATLTNDVRDNKQQKCYFSKDHCCLLLLHVTVTLKCSL